MIAEIASELLRVEGTSIGIAVAVTERGTDVSVRADSRLLGDDPVRIVRVINFLLEYAFPGVSGFKHEKRPPHRVEGGACVPHDETQLRMWSPRGGPQSHEAMLEHCRGAAAAIVAALQDLKFARPEEAQRIRAQSLAVQARLGGLTSLAYLPLSEVRAVAWVEAGQEIVRVFPATAGKPGMDVFRRPFSVKGTEGLKFKHSSLR